jgi:Glutaminase
MKHLFLALLFSSMSALAQNRITTAVNEIDFGNSPADEILVFLKSGDVARLKSVDMHLLERLQEEKSWNGQLTFNLDEDRYITSVENSEQISNETEKNTFIPFEVNYVPSTLANKSVGAKLISEGKIPTKEQTQCFNRAMVWVYEWWRNHSLKTNKVFVFWSKEYVRKYSFKWWFHVSPYAHIKDETGIVKEMVLDVKWLRKPYEFQDWVDYHATKDIKCKVVTKYADYADYPFEEACFFIRENMYFWQPADLEMRDAWGYSKNAFNMTEVKAAYLEAFDITL